MLKRMFFGLFILAIGTVLSADGARHLMRRPDISSDHIVFTYEDDLFICDASGGNAYRLTDGPGAERYGKFSPDGRRIAFTGSYDGGTDVYVMDAEGGEVRRLTWHPARDRVLGWTPDGEKILFRSDRVMPFRAEEIYAVPVSGGMPERLPVDQAGLASLSPDGTMLAYNRITREDRTWKRHQGGTAQDIWVGSLSRGDFHRVTDWEGTDNYPMWIAGKIYFLSDRKHGTMNLYRMNPDGSGVETLTEYRDYDVKYPSAGPDGIIFQYGESLHFFDTGSGSVREIPVVIRSDRVAMRMQRVRAGSHCGSFRPTPDGDALLLETMGELILVPTNPKDEITVLTHSSGAREKDAVMSPDGKRIAFLSDASGEEELWVMQADGTGAKQLTDDRIGFRFRPLWSPDSRWVLFGDKSLALNLVDVETGRRVLVDRGEYDDAWYRWGIQDYVFSPDSQWIAYSKVESSLNDSVFLYRIADGKVFRVTGPETRDWSPAFSHDGKYLYLLSDRTLRPVMGRMDQNHIFFDMTRPYLVLLDAAQSSPFNDVSKRKTEDAATRDEPDTTAGITVHVDPEGLSDRLLLIPGVTAGDYDRLEAIKDGFLLLQRSGHPFLKYQEVDDRKSASLTLKKYTLEDDSIKKLLGDVANYHVTADGKYLAYRSGKDFGIIKPGKKIPEDQGKVDPGKTYLRLDRLKAFEQIFDEAWRIQRDWFYDPGMHGVDWKAVREKYRVFLPDCGNRADLNYLIGEMIGELNAGHTYIYGGDRDEVPQHVPVGLLGADIRFTAGSPYPKIEHIVPGNHWNPSERSPLQEPGCSIRNGSYLVSIDGRTLEKGTNLYSYLEDTADHSIDISFSGHPDGSDARTCRIRPLGSEYGLRYRAWVEANRRFVTEKSGGRLGYLHIPNMMDRGLVEFARGWYHDFTKEGFIIDERYNTGGFVGDMIIDRLTRKVWAYTKPREGRPIPSPERAMRGPLAVLINEGTSSNGEYFAETIKIKGIAPLIGVRTWGGAVGIEPHQHLTDGATTTPPQFAPYGLDGHWLIEGHGVDPDIVVENAPGDVLDGKDAQLERAVDYLMEKITENPQPVPQPPPYVDRSKPE